MEEPVVVAIVSCRSLPRPERRPDLRYLLAAETGIGGASEFCRERRHFVLGAKNGSTRAIVATEFLPDVRGFMADGGSELCTVGKPLLANIDSVIAGGVRPYPLNRPPGPSWRQSAPYSPIFTMADAGTSICVAGVQ